MSRDHGSSSPGVDHTLPRRLIRSSSFGFMKRRGKDEASNQSTPASPRRGVFVRRRDRKSSADDSGSPLSRRVVAAADAGSPIAFSGPSLVSTPSTRKGRGRRPGNNVAEESTTKVANPLLNALQVKAAKEQRKVIASGTRDELLTELLQPRCDDYRDDFLLMLRSIIPPLEFLDWIGDHLALADKSQRNVLKKLAVQWVDCHFTYFERDPELLQALIDFVESHTKGCTQQRLRELLKYKTELYLSDPAVQTERAQSEIALFQRMVRKVGMKDAEVRPGVWRECFTGMVAINWVHLCNEDEDISSRAQAMNLCQRMLDRGLFVNATDSRDTAMSEQALYTVTSKGIAFSDVKIPERAALRTLATVLYTMLEVLQPLEDVVCGNRVLDIAYSGDACLRWLQDHATDPFGSTPQNARDTVQAWVDNGWVSSVHGNGEDDVECFARNAPFFVTERGLQSIKMHTIVSPDALLSPRAAKLTTPSLFEGDMERTIPNIVSVHPLEVARQLCILDRMKMIKISTNELDNLGWKDAGNSPHVCDWIDSFNHTSYWVATEVLTWPWPEERKALFKKFVMVAEYLREMGNFQSMMAVMAGLSLHSVARLRDLSKVTAGKLAAVWDTLTEYTSSRNNFSRYRAVLKESHSPAIPYLGLLLQDLIGIEESYPDTVEGGAINFAKLRRVAAVKRELRRFQSNETTFEPVVAIQRYITAEALVLQSDQLYAMSLKIQTRTRDH